MIGRRGWKRLVGFAFNVTFSWEDRYEQLYEHVVAVRSCRPRTTQTGLYRWCQKQQDAKQKWEGKGEKEGTKYETWVKREEKLDELGFWDEW